jgi:hypothetical protein
MYIYKFLSSYCKNSKSILQVEIVLTVLRLKSITLCSSTYSLKSTYAACFIFDLERKFLFLDFAVRKRNIFSRPGK